MPTDDALTQLVRHVSQAAGLLAFLLGFCVFMLIHRITKDAGYLLLSMGFLVQFLLSLFYMLFTRLLVSAMPSGVFTPLLQFVMPLFHMFGGILLIAGFLMVGARARKKLRRAPEVSPGPTTESPS